MSPYFLSLEYSLLGELMGMVEWTYYLCVLRDIADEENQ